jgi:hypothetical protein
MENKEVKVILKTGHEVILKNDAPDIGALVKAIVQIREDFNPDELSIECGYEGFDKASFKEVIIEATNSFIKEMKLDKASYEAALSNLSATSNGNSVNV